MILNFDVDVNFSICMMGGVFFFHLTIYICAIGHLCNRVETSDE